MNLVGQVTLEKGKDVIRPLEIHAVVSDPKAMPQHSDATHLRIRFNTNQAANKGYDLILINATGKAVVQGFEIVDK